MTRFPVLIGGEWIESTGSKSFQAVNPASAVPIDGEYPVSPWSEIENAIGHAAAASKEMRGWTGEPFARFLETYASRLESRKAEIVQQAHLETALPAEGRLANTEFPRTINQLRMFAGLARSETWRFPVIDLKANIRAQYAALGPVVVFGPNNFPFAFNGISGGDFAAAIASGNPVIAKGHSSHPGTTRLFAEEALAAIADSGMPKSLVQLIYRTEHADGLKLVSHPLIGATGYTGGRGTGLALKAAADQAGKPIYLELSSVNPVVMLPGALSERGEKLAEEFATSCLMGTGQFCTNPGLVLFLKSIESNAFQEAVQKRFASAPVGTLLSSGVSKNLGEGIKTLAASGARILTGGQPGGGQGACFQNTLLATTGEKFLADPHGLQTEAFGNASLFVECTNLAELLAVLESLEGNLTGCVYSATDGTDDAHYASLEPVLRIKVGRLLNDKMPTGVAVSAAMNHGGPYPSTGHPSFSAVGHLSALWRFSRLESYDNVREPRLPRALRNKAVDGLWRLVDGAWTQSDLS